MIEAHLKSLLAQLVNDTTGELDGVVRETAMRLSEAAGIGRNDIALECARQLEVLIRIKKIKVRKAFAPTFPFILQTGITMLLNGLIAGLAQAKIQ